MAIIHQLTFPPGNVFSGPTAKPTSGWPMRIEALDASAIHTCAVVKNDWGRGTKQFPCMPGTKGSKVKITLTGKAQLHMCEVQVFGTQG